VTAAHPLHADLDAALERAEADLRVLSGGRMLVTGGTGFVGSWLLELVAWGVRRLGLDIGITALTRQPQVWAARMPHLAADSTITTLAGDVRSFDFPSGEFASMVLGAATSDNAWTTANPTQVVDTIVTGTIRALACADACGVSRLLLLSSGAVYGRQPPDLAAIPEDHPGAPPLQPTGEAAYAQAKRTAEVLVALAARPGRRAVAARIFNVYGPYLPLDSHFAIGNFLRDAVRGQAVTVRGDGSPVRSYLYGADLAVGLLACLARGASGDAYNVGGSEPIRLGELARLVASLASPPVEVRVLGEPGGDDRYVPDVRRIAADLGVEPAVSLAEGVLRSMVWVRRHAEGA
jgi:dTDP-glucose 4,6-dehydratase